MFNYYLFDYDGTICNTRPTIIASLQRAFEANHLQPPATSSIITAVSNGIPLHETIHFLHPQGAQLSVSDTEILAALYREQYLAHDAHLTLLFEGALTVFQQLKAAGKVVIVLSNKGIAAVEKSLQLHGLSEYTDMVIAEGILPHLQLKPKPDAMIYEKVISQQFRIKSGTEVLMTGDTHADILFAKNSGITSCWAAYGYGQPERCQSLSPDHTIQQLQQVLQLP